MPTKPRSAAKRRPTYPTPKRGRQAPFNSDRAKNATLQKVLLIPDVHAPFHSRPAVSLLLKAMEWWKPEVIVDLGDFSDFYSVSSHSKAPSRVNRLEQEIEGCNALLDQFDALGAGRKIYVSGNHEDRLDRYLADRAPELDGLVSTQELLRLEERGWEWVPYKQSIKLGHLNITHDCGQAGAYAHYRALDAFQSNVVLGHCVPLTYEVLTRRGFVPLPDVRVGEMVLAYENGAVVETPVLEKVEFEPHSDMVEFDNHVISQRMTTLHHIYTKDGRYVPVIEALDSLTKDDLVRFAAPLPGSEFPISDALLRLVIAYCADGSRASPGTLRFHLKKPRKIERLQELFAAAGGSVDFAPPGGNGGRKTISMTSEIQRSLIELAPDKRLPDWLLSLSARQRQIIIDELPLWDGSIIRREGEDQGSRQFCSWKAEEVALVQMLLAQHGIRSRRSASGRVVTYDILRHTKTVDARRKLRECATIRPNKDERVGCISTRQQNFFLRTDQGSVELTGNTHRLGITYVGNAEGSSHVGGMFGWLGDVDAVDYLHRIQALRAWHLGFGIGYLESNGTVHLQAVPIIRTGADYRLVLEGRLFQLTSTGAAR